MDAKSKKDKKKKKKGAGEWDMVVGLIDVCASSCTGLRHVG